MRRSLCVALLILVCGLSMPVGESRLLAQALGEADRGEPGDRMVQDYLDREARRIEHSFLEGISTQADWQQSLERRRREYLTMLGLWPLPERTPLAVQVTGNVQGEGYAVDLLHYQSRPGLYVTANLYRPAESKPGERLPAVLYVCGHAHKGRDGNKTAFQSFGIWFARHGYVCLVVDTLQLGEIAATHHGTYNQGRWWWHSRGYTPAGVECWNGTRGIDYLLSRGDVDPERVAVTGASGGGAATFWVAAADPRVKVAVPVSGMSELRAYVAHRVINGHCDCMFLYNNYQWSWTQIAALVAPRPLCFVNSDHDRIFPMDANRRITNRLERMYSLFAAGDVVDSYVSIGPHAYRPDLRQVTYRFINTHLKNDARHVDDANVDAWGDEGGQPQPPIALSKLRVFPSDADIPKDQLNTTIDEHFVPVAKVELPAEGSFAAWQAGLLAQLKSLPLRTLPDRVPPARVLEQKQELARLGSEDGIEFYLERVAGPAPAQAKRVLLVIAGDDAPALGEAAKSVVAADDAIFVCEPRGLGRTRWTRNNPPNYVARSLALIGRTVDTGRLCDVIAAARYLASQSLGNPPLHVVGQGNSALLAAYAAALEPDVAGALLVDPLLTHGDSRAPQLLSVLRVCDVPELLGLVAPKPLAIIARSRPDLTRSKAIYAAADAPDRLTLTELK